MRGDRLRAWKRRVSQLKTEVHALSLAYRDPRVPWYARVYLAFVIGYILSPIDPIPDVIPLVGYLDELLLVPVFIVLGRRMIPADVLAEHRATAQSSASGTRTHWIAAAVIIAVWVAVTAAGIVVLARCV
jgi:uncharacterized membrane protein YkvA (DUF1232 family)